MKNLFYSFWILLLFLQCQPNNDHSTQFQTSNGYRYETVTNDPTNTRIYTLDNGLKVYLSRYEDSPRIQVFTAIKAGGKNDPANNTGLEIREAQGLAYSVFSQYIEGLKKERSNYLVSYVGIQSDKQKEAMERMHALIQQMPESESAFEIAKTSILNQLESERITKANIIQAYFSAQDKGLDEDLRERIYREVKRMTFDDLLNFHQLYIKNLQQSIALIGKR